MAPKEEKKQRKERRKQWRKRAHPFFWLLWLLLAPAIAAAVFAPNRAPGYALHSAWVYRLEVGGAFYIGLFVLGLILWLGYTGRSVGNLQLPGGVGVGVPPPNPAFDDAATGLKGYTEQTDGRLKKLEENIELLMSEDDPPPGAPKSPGTAGEPTPDEASGDG